MELEHLKMMNDLTTDQNCFLSYVGTMSEDALELFGQKLRRHMRRFSLSPKQNRHAFSLYVEMMQNMIRYGDAGDHYPNPDGSKPSYGFWPSAMKMMKSVSWAVIIFRASKHK